MARAWAQPAGIQLPQRGPRCLPPSLGPLPDLFSPGSRMPVRLEPSLLLLDHLGGAELETISLPRALAVDLLARFDWLAAPHPVLWRQIVEAVA